VQHLLGVACDLPSTCNVRAHRPPTRDHMSASYCGPDCAHSRHALPMDRSTRLPWKKARLRAQKDERGSQDLRGINKDQPVSKSRRAHFATMACILPCQNWEGGRCPSSLSAGCRRYGRRHRDIDWMMAIRSSCASHAAVQMVSVLVLHESRI
jgi:hypothetical protein